MGHQGKLTTPAVFRMLLLASLAIATTILASTGSAWAQVGSARYSAIIVEAAPAKSSWASIRTNFGFPPVSPS